MLPHADDVRRLPAARPSRPSRRSFLAAAAALTLAACSRGQDEGAFNGIDLSGARMRADFTLLDTEGNPRSIRDFPGQVVMLFYGFTQCPDVCPTALLRAAEVRRMLGADGQRVQVLFVTVDPERDTPEVLAAYTRAFDESFIGLYGDADATRAAADALKVYYHKMPTDDSYTVDHTSYTYLFDTEGRLRVGLRHAQTPEEYAHDVRQLLAHG